MAALYRCEHNIRRWNNKAWCRLWNDCLHLKYL